MEDLALLYSIIAGLDGRDTEVSPAPVEPTPKLELERLRIAFASTFPGFPVAMEISDAIRELATQLDPLCAVVEEAALSDLDFGEELMSFGELTGMPLACLVPKSVNGPPP